MAAVLVIGVGGGGVQDLVTVTNDQVVVICHDMPVRLSYGSMEQKSNNKQVGATLTLLAPNTPYDLLLNSPKLSL